MTDVTFTPNVTTIDASWLQGLNDFYNTVFDGATSKSQAADAINALDSVTNVGTGTGNLYKGLTGARVDLRTISGSGNLTVATVSDDIDISVDSVTSSSNTGTGTTLAKARSADDLPFKTIKAGSNITITDGADDITLDATGTLSTIASNVTFDSTNVPSSAVDAQSMMESISPLAYGQFIMASSSSVYHLGEGIPSKLGTGQFKLNMGGYAGFDTSKVTALVNIADLGGTGTEVVVTAIGSSILIDVYDSVALNQGTVSIADPNTFATITGSTKANLTASPTYDKSTGASTDWWIGQDGSSNGLIQIDAAVGAGNPAATFNYFELSGGSHVDLTITYVIFESE